MKKKTGFLKGNWEWLLHLRIGIIYSDHLIDTTSCTIQLCIHRPFGCKINEMNDAYTIQWVQMTQLRFGINFRQFVNHFWILQGIWNHCMKCVRESIWYNAHCNMLKKWRMCLMGFIHHWKWKANNRLKYTIFNEYFLWNFA